MKTQRRNPIRYHRFRADLTAAVLFMLATVCARAQSETWHIVLPSGTSGSSPSGSGNDVLINPFTPDIAPGVFLGTTLGGSDTKSLFRLTPSDVASSAFVIEAVDGGLQSVTKIAYKPDDGLYAVGHAVSTGGKRSSSTMYWKVRRSKSADQGNLNTWQDDDSFQFSTKSKNSIQPLNARAMGIATDGYGRVIGNVLVCGWANDGTVNHWIIRKKSASGWATVLDLKATDPYSFPYKMCFVPQGGNNAAAAHFVSGILNDQWTILRSRDQGVSWEAVGPWPEDGSQAEANDMASDSNGNIYVVGVRGRDGYNRGWVVRRSADGGTIWETLLDQPSEDDSWAVRLAIDSGNNITVAGAIDGVNGPRWAVVRHAPGQLWSDSWANAIFPLGEEVTGISKGRGMAVDASGILFLTGDVSNWTDAADGTVYSGTGLLRMVP